jgi:nitroreductase
MDFYELVKQRQSARKYLRREIEPEKLKRILESARLAPSASNSQPWHIIVVDNPELLTKVGEAATDSISGINKFAKEAAVILVIVLEAPKFITSLAATIKRREFPLIDIGILAEHICLQATEEGIGNCMIGWFNEIFVKKLLDIPRKKRIGLLITLGYVPDDYPLRKKIRKELNKIVTFNSYSHSL